MTDDEHTKMAAELTALCTQWNRAGIPPVSIIAFLLKAATDTAEHAGVDHGTVTAVVDNAYGRNNIIRPTVKA